MDTPQLVASLYIRINIISLYFPVERFRECIILFDHGISELDICYVFYDESESFTNDLFSVNCKPHGHYKISFPRNYYFSTISGT